MEDRETARMGKYGESKTTRIMMTTVPHVTSGLGLRKFQAEGFLLTRVYETARRHVPGQCNMNPECSANLQSKNNTPSHPHLPFITISL